jgi:hypothetical protein
MLDMAISFLSRHICLKFNLCICIWTIMFVFCLIHLYVDDYVCIFLLDFLLILPIFPFFLIMSKGREECIYVCVFSCLLDIQVHYEFLNKHKSWIKRETFILGGVFRKTHKHQVCICHHQKGGECENKLLKLKLFWWRQIYERKEEKDWLWIQRRSQGWPSG